MVGLGLRRSGTAAGYASGGVGGAVPGREAAQVLAKATSSTAWATVSAVMKSKLADVIARGDTAAVVNLAARVGASRAVQSNEDEEQPRQPFR